MIFSPHLLPAPLDLARFFGRTAPVEVDLGCGKGRFLLARAVRHPERNWIGTDIQYGRLVKIRSRAEQANLSNLRLLHTETAYALEYLLPPGSVRTFFLFFPDPWPKRKHHRRRLVQAEFFTLIHRALEPGGTLHVATDHAAYFNQIQQAAQADPRFLRASPFVPEATEKTEFETLFSAQGLPIHRYSCQKQSPS